MSKPSLDEVLGRRKGAVIETDRGQGLIKAFASPPSYKSDEEGRTARFIMTTESEDRYGDVVVQSGIDTTWFNKNPIALWMHNHFADPLGQWDEVKTVSGKPKRTEGLLRFAPEGAFESVDKIVKYVEHGIYRAVSIGFMPKDWEWIKDEDGHHTWGIRFAESELIECSVVAVGANQEALVKAAGMDKTLVLEVMEDVLDNWAKTADGLIVPRDQFEGVYKTVKSDVPTDIDLRKVALNPPAEQSDDADTDVDPIHISVDTKDAEKKISKLTDMVDGLLAKCRELAGMTEKDVDEDHVDPPIDDPEPDPEPEAADASEVEMALAEAALATAEGQKALEHT